MRERTFRWTSADGGGGMYDACLTILRSFASASSRFRAWPTQGDVGWGRAAVYAICKANGLGLPRRGSRRWRVQQSLQRCTCDLLLSDVTDSTPSLLMRPECWSSKASYHHPDPRTVNPLYRHCPTRCHMRKAQERTLTQSGKKSASMTLNRMSTLVFCVHTALVTICAHMAG